MPDDDAYLEPIRAAALAVLAPPPPLTVWEAGDEDDGEVVDHRVEDLLQQLGWPTRSETHTVRCTVFGSWPPELGEPHECTTRYFPGG